MGHCLCKTKTARRLHQHCKLHWLDQHKIRLIIKYKVVHIWLDWKVQIGQKEHFSCNNLTPKMISDFQGPVWSLVLFDVVYNFFTPNLPLFISSDNNFQQSFSEFSVLYWQQQTEQTQHRHYGKYAQKTSKNCKAYFGFSSITFH